MKKWICILCIAILMIVLSACKSQTESEEMIEEYSKRNPNVFSEIESPKEETNMNGLLFPYPNNGEVVATINNMEYRYDPLYLFQLCISYNEDWNEMTKKNVYDAVALEVLAMDGKEHGEVVSWQHVEGELNKRKQVYENDPNAEYSRLSLINATLEREQITKNEFWVRQYDFARKACYFENSNDWETQEYYSFYDDHVKELFEKYNVEILVTFE